MEWRSSWSYLPLDFRAYQFKVENETQRIIFKNNLNGNKIRLLFSNKYGNTPLQFSQVYLGEKGQKSVTFEGKETLLLQPGDSCYSDEVLFPAKAGEEIVISTYVKEKMEVACGCSFYSKAIANVINASGNLCKKVDFPAKVQADYMDVVINDPPCTFIYGLISVDVYTGEKVKTIAAFGDSITHQSYWCGEFSRRLYEKYPGQVSLINRGIGGNRILHDTTELVNIYNLFGDAGIKRFEKDVFDTNAVELVIALEGINDIFHPSADAPKEEEVTAEEIIAGLCKYADITHKHNAKIMIGTILPFKKFEFWNSTMEEKRNAVNQWIRTQKVFDETIDFDNAIKDANDLAKMNSAYDSGDHLHPSENGGIHMAEIIPFML